MPIRLLRRHFLGILPRYVFGEILRAFGLALLTITFIFVLFVVMAEATRQGLTPQDVLRIIPFVIPSILPYTIPVALLFAVTVVYGRLASDNEVIAVKTAGLSAWVLLAPSIVLGLGLSAGMHVMGQTLIPSATHQVQKYIWGNLEDMFYKVLKKDRQFDNPYWPFLIKVRNVEGKVMKDALFKHRAGGPDNPNTFDLVVSSKSATIAFDVDHHVARVYLGEDSSINGGGERPFDLMINNREIEIPIPDTSKFNSQVRIQEMTVAEIRAQQAHFLGLIARERKLQAIAAAMWIGSGRLERVDWKSYTAAFQDYQYWERKVRELETEKNQRVQLSWGSFFFVLLGAPVGIRFAKRDFLSAFITCFLPIIVIYYPLTLAGVNLGKEGVLPPWIALAMGNIVLGFLAGFFALPPVLRH